MPEASPTCSSTSCWCARSCHLLKKDAPFRVIETHAGAGRYDLSGDKAARTGEWRGGIGRLVERPLTGEAAALIEPYLSLVRAANSGEALKIYPGSPLIARTLLRPQDRMIFCELHPEERAALIEEHRPRPAREGRRDRRLGRAESLRAAQGAARARADRPAVRGRERIRAPRSGAQGSAQPLGDGNFAGLVSDQGPARDAGLRAPAFAQRNCENFTHRARGRRPPPGRAARGLRHDCRQSAVDFSSAR